MALCRNVLVSRTPVLSCCLFMLVIVLPWAAVLLDAADCLAEIRYVKPRSEAVVRTGQGNEYKIVGVVKEGVTVELLGQNDDYSQVRLENGTEGWILRRYLSAEPPLGIVVENLRREKEVLQQQEAEASKKFEETSVLLSAAKTELDALIAERDRIVADYQQLQRDTADVMKIRNDMRQTAEENQQLVEKLVALEGENGQLKKDRTINWFLAGGGVLLLGILLGKMPAPSRRRKSSLLS